jgi:hypothetical protein
MGGVRNLGNAGATFAFALISGLPANLGEMSVELELNP